MAEALTGKRLEILEYISECLRDRGYPPSVREIGEAVGLASSATVHTHLAVLQREGYLQRDPSKPRAIRVRYDPSSKLAMAAGPVRHVPLVGEVAAGTGVLAQENVEEVLSLPERFTGTGSTFMLRVRGDSMVGAGIYDGDYVVVREQPKAEAGDVVVAGIPDEEATVKRYSTEGDTVVLTPANQRLAPLRFDRGQVAVGRLRQRQVVDPDLGRFIGPGAGEDGERQQRRERHEADGQWRAKPCQHGISRAGAAPARGVCSSERARGATGAKVEGT